MTTDELGPELTGERTALTAAEALNICDRILGEPARRRHLFAWLRAPGAAADEWLPVDGYYPANKLIVVWHATAAATDSVYSELVPAHGFKLLELAPQAVGSDPAEAEARLRARIDKLGPVPRRSREPRAREARARREREPRAREAGSRDAPPRQSARAGAVSSFVPGARVAEPVPPGAGFGAVLGVILVTVGLAELYLGV